MKNIIENIKSYFSNNETSKNSDTTPEGMCPNCWGHSEWDNEFYKIKKDKHLVPEKDIYESFISKIVAQHIATTHKHETKYICTTCDKEI